MLLHKTRDVGVLLGVMTLALFPATLAAQDGGDAQANNPLAQTTSLNFQTQYTGSITGTDGDANSVLLRYAVPFSAFGGEWISRFTLPINTGTLPDGSSETAIGDFNFFAAYLFDTGDPAVSFGFGPSLTAPTATDDRLGSEKWSVGFANILFNARNPKFQWGYLLQWQTSVAGNGDRKGINIGAFQPFGFYQ